MADFLIYLFESGLCLTLFYLGYAIFFRKETYFTFNRIYLLISMVLALILPITNISIGEFSTGYFSTTLQSVNKFRNYYEELIFLTDPEFQVAYNNTTVPPELANSEALVSENQQSNTSFNLLAFIFYTYLAGLFFFILRFFVLIINLLQIVRRGKKVKYDNFTLVLINENVPSFSFLKWVFINKEILHQNEFEQVITHEKIHVEHKHSVDLILAHIITMLQWFNPLTWRLQKSLKTCHEYIADRQVIHQGHEIFDYQSLLLSQLISIRSVELVNNFNLLSIKKRIAMMNKIKSGPIAKLKALVIIPLICIGFFFFADITAINIEKLEFNQLSENNDLIGLWEVVEIKTGDYQFIEFKNNNLITIKALGHSNVEIKEYNLKVKPKKLVLEDSNGKRMVDYSLTKDYLSIKWDTENEVKYLRNNKKERYVLADKIFRKYQLPSARSVKTFDKDFIAFRLMLNSEGLFYKGRKYDLDEINQIIKSVKLPEDKSKVNKMSVLLEIDESVKMVMVDKIKTALRNNNFFKIGYIVKSLNSKHESQETALFMKLPPKDAKLLEENLVPNLFEIKHSDNQELSKKATELRDFIEGHKKYVMIYKYNNKTSYSDYIATVDMVFNAVFKLRQEAAFFDGVNYDELSNDEQKKYRKKYPITLSQKNLDIE